MMFGYHKLLDKISELEKQIYFINEEYRIFRANAEIYEMVTLKYDYKLLYQGLYGRPFTDEVEKLGYKFMGFSKLNSAEVWVKEKI